jgi:hypothetical protein
MSPHGQAAIEVMVSEQMTTDLAEDALLHALPHPDDEKVLAAAREALLEGMRNVFIVGEDEFHIDACFLALYQQLKLVPGLQLHRMMSPKVDDIVELFNTVLSDLSIEEARNHQAQERHIIVMPDFGPNAGKEWMACESLVNTFPGANVGMLAFSTLDNHDASTLQQLSLKARNKLMRLTPMDDVVMERYLGECHARGVLVEMLPSLQDSQWYELASSILGLDAEDAIKQSVSDYDEVMSEAAEISDELEVLADPAAEVSEEASIAKPRKRLINWRALLPRISSLISVAFIILFAGALLLVVAGTLHPPIWETTQIFVKPWFDQLMIWLGQLLEYLPR